MDPRLLQAIALMLVAYLSGSIPVGALVARRGCGLDLRAVGSGRTGGTNALRGGAAVAGAIWSVFAGFRSGRGVGTGVGTMLVIEPIAVLLAAPVFVLVTVLTRYVSLGSLLGSAAIVPAMLLLLALGAATPFQYVVYAAVGAAFIWLAHADNIDRLIHGKERKFDLGMLGGKRPNR